MKWLNYTGVGITCLCIGYVLHSEKPEPPSPNNNSALEQKTALSSVAEQLVPTQEKPHFEREPDIDQQASASPQPCLKYSALIQQLAEQNPAAHQRIQQENQLAMLKAIFSETAKSNPAYAASLLDEMTDQDVKDSLVDDLILAWVDTNPKAAFGWYTHLNQDFDQGDHEYFMDSIVVPLARMNPEYAWSIIDQIENGNRKEMMLEEIAGGWVSKNPEAAFDWLESLTANKKISSSELKNCYSTAMTKYMEINPVEAARIVMELNSNSLQCELVEPAVRHLAQENLNSAMDWVLQLNTKTARETGINEIITSFADKQPELVLDFVLNNLDHSADGLEQIGSAFSTASERHPELAVKMLKDAPEDTRNQLVGTIAFNWLDLDEDKASKWLISQPAGPKLDVGASSAALHYLRDKPEMAFEWACAVSNQEKRKKLLNELVEYSDINKLKEVYLAVNNAPLTAAERAPLEALLDKRLNDEYATLVLP